MSGKQEVLTNGRLGAVLDSFELKKESTGTRKTHHGSARANAADTSEQSSGDAFPRGPWERDREGVDGDAQ